VKSKWWLVSLLVCLAIASLAPLASSSPDGLERVAEDKGFIGQASGPPFQIIADYVFPGIESEKLATILAGLIGTIILFGIAYAVARLLALRTKKIAFSGDEREA
jgi:hypothetical protein